MKKTREEKAITLIALIITIVVLLILAVVAINAVTGDGIIQHATNARDSYENAQEKEQSVLSYYESYLQTEGQVGKWLETGETVERTNSDGIKENVPAIKKVNENGTVVILAIGDYVDYNYDATGSYELTSQYSGASSDKIYAQTTGLQWRVMGVNSSGELELISATPTDVAVYLNDAVGYNNGVYILNDICKKQYSNSVLGITARNLNIEDIEKRYSENGINARGNFISTASIQYGNTQSYTSDSNIYPILYAEEAKSGVQGSIRTGGISSSAVFYKSSNEFVSIPEGTANGNLVVTQTYYNLDTNPANSYFNNTMFNDLIFTEDAYWVASRCVNCTSSGLPAFALHRVVGYTITGTRMVYSNSEPQAEDKACLLRPVVSIGSDIDISGTGENIGRADNKWKLNK